MTTQTEIRSAAEHIARYVRHAPTDGAIRAAQSLLRDALRLVAEPGGAAALAALTSGAWALPPGARVGVIICGANTDPALVAA